MKKKLATYSYTLWTVLTRIAASYFTRYLVRRILFSLLVVFGVLVIVFFLSRLVPANPALLYAGSHPTAEQIRQAEIKLHLNEPPYVQFFYYLSDILRGDLGESIVSRRPVWFHISSTFPASFELVSFAMLLSIAVGIPIGVISAIKKNTIVDHTSRVFAIGGVSLPSFWLALLLQLLFANWLGILPPQFRAGDAVLITYPLQQRTGMYLVDSLISWNLPVFFSSFRHIILPALTLAAYPIGLIARMVRTMMIEVMSENYIRTAKAYSIPEGRIFYSYALRNAIAPSLVVLGLSFAYSIIGAFLIEVIFSWGGLGTFAYSSIINFDYPSIVGVAIFVSIIYVVVNLVVDFIQSFLDPRVRLEVKRAW